MNQQETIIEKLNNSLPAVFVRTEIDKLLPGIINSKTLANLSCSGKGPQFYKIGRKCVYERETFLAWLGKKTKKIEL